MSTCASTSASASSSACPGPKPMHPLQIPEILLGVGAHLSIRDLRSCLRVCVTFHGTLAPLIWSTAILKDDQRRLIPKATVQANAHLIQHLLLACEHDDQYLQTYASLTFPNLKKLTINGSALSSDEAWQSAMSGPLPLFILRHKDTLEGLDFANFVSTADTSKFWTSLSKVTGLSHLLFADSTMLGNKSMQAFWGFIAQDSLKWIHLHQLKMRGNVPSRVHAGKPYKLQEVTFAGLDIQDDMFVALMTYLHLSTNLRSLTWEAVYQKSQRALLEKVYFIQPLTDIIQRTDHRFPALRLWRLNGPGSGDLVLANFLNALSHGLTDVHLRRTYFGPLAFKALMAHHAVTLTNLDLTQCENSKCAMTQQILCVCPALISIKGRGLHASDVMKTKECPWVCHRLEEWVLSIHMDTKNPYDKAAHREIFGRLSLLTRLKQLNLMGDTEGLEGRASHLEPSPFPTISMQLSLGLGQIRTLQGLKLLLFNGADEGVSINDIRFLYGTFPAAGHIGCSLSRQLMFHPDLPKIVNERKRNHGGSVFAR